MGDELVYNKYTDRFIAMIKSRILNRARGSYIFIRPCLPRACICILVLEDRRLAEMKWIDIFLVGSKE